MAERKLEVDDFKSITDPVDTASVNAVNYHLLKRAAIVNSLKEMFPMVNQPCV